MHFQRSSGVLLHISSLPSYGGIGDLGPAAHEFVAFLAAAKQHVWQVLPLCPTGYGNSPYAGSSAFAGNPFLISLEFLADWGWIGGERIAGLAGRAGNVDFDELEATKVPLLYEAAGNFLDRGPHDPELAGQWQRSSSSAATEESWLADYALYAELRRQYGTGAWTEWPEPMRRREPQALAQVCGKAGRALAQEQALQFAFAVQWSNSARGCGAERESASWATWRSLSTWIQPTCGCIPASLSLMRMLKPVRIAGVPPDYFSPTGQRWGNPLYRWDVLAAQNGFDWWVQRIRRARQLYDIIRLDHFRGFEAYWSIPADEETAVNGEWVKAPGLELFRALEAALGAAAAGGRRPGADYAGGGCAADGIGNAGDEGDPVWLWRQGRAHPPSSPIHTRHRGLYRHPRQRHHAGLVEHGGKVERDAVEAYVGPVPVRNGVARPAWPLIRATAASVAQMAVVPAQDLLELGSEARMNTPAVAAGNWSWRVPEGSWTPELAARLAAIAEVTDRDNDPLREPEAADLD